ncbi:MAG: hypothetical protein KGI41_00285 [Patescibacteria group bacterium]|nr:hypothetical protein [Patescibacteria group bacterium]MDE1965670.1 hypothetical protein [Patescibacteria group bacterium]
MKYVDNFLNGITMYRLVLYHLIALLALAALFGAVGWLPYAPLSLAYSTAVVLAASWLSNRVFAWTFDAIANVESVYITALILVLIITPVAPGNLAGTGFLIFASVWAMASKFIFAVGKRHVFNPAAFGVALSALLISQSATWWVGGNLILLPFVLVGGFLITRKVQRFDLVLAFFAVTFVSLLATSGNPLTGVMTLFLHTPFIFFASVMLTEPLTTPPNRWLRMGYGALVGLLFSPNFSLFGFFFTPELALIAGNVFSWAASPKGRFMLALKEVRETGSGVYDFVFESDRAFAFSPGQYLEWTLAHASPDGRGNRRYFTIASSPTEGDVHLGVKFYKKASSFKRALAAMKIGDKISVSHLAGEFTLPRDPKKKLAFIAGGIGVTPFRSMIQYLVDKKEPRSVVMLYANRKAEDVSYEDVFEKAQNELGIRTVYALSDEKGPIPGAHAGSVDAELIRKKIPDYAERIFYISGPHGMVSAFTDTLAGMGVPRRHIRSDFFPGFA